MILNPEQQRAVEHEGNCLVVACPGSGKTRLLVNKAARILRLNPEARLILVSFTRDSVAELRIRIAKELNGPIPKNCVVSTFHSLALLQLRRGLKKNEKLPKLICGEQQSDYVRRAFQKHSDGTLDEESAAALIETCRTSLDYIPEAGTPAGDMVIDYGKMLARNKVMDMSDILMRVVSGLFDGSIEPFSADYMMIDEFQDTDEIQFQWMMCHYQRGSKITVVGDDDQSIYGFRRALGYGGMLRFAEDTGAEEIKLGTNYRCREEILRAGEVVILPNEDRIDKELVADRGNGGVVQLSSHVTGIEEATWVARGIKAKILNENLTRLNYGIFAVIARNNRQLELVEAMLTAEHIPYVRTGKSIWEKYPVCIFLEFLVSLQTGASRGIDQFLSWIVSNQDDVDELHHQLGIQLHLLLTDGISLDFGKFSSLGREKIKSFMQVAPAWRMQASTPINEDQTDVISKIIGWIEEMSGQKRGLSVLLLAAKILQQHFTGSLQDRVKSVLKPKFDKKENDEDDSRNGVFLTTMHGSKGLEFNYVWVIGVNTKIIPSEKTQENEERRLLYVAATRAKDELAISHYDAPSIFFLEIKSSMEDQGEPHPTETEEAISGT